MRALALSALPWLLICAACEGPPDQAEATAPAAPTVEGIAPAVLASLPDGITVEMLQEGRRNYATCSVCHGGDAAGTELGPSLRDTVWIHISGTPEEIVQITRSGVEAPLEFPIPMPARGGSDFDDRELEAIAAYLHALGRS